MELSECDGASALVAMDGDGSSENGGRDWDSMLLKKFLKVREKGVGS